MLILSTIGQWHIEKDADSKVNRILLNNMVFSSFKKSTIFSFSVVRIYIKKVLGIDMVLIEEKNDLTIRDESRHIYHPFLLREEVNSFLINFSYSPGTCGDIESIDRIITAYKKVKLSIDFEEAKALLPLNNLVTLSLEGPMGFIGNAHRHRDKQVINISNIKSDPGFKSASLIPGIYTVCISTHCIVSSRLEYSLKVESI